MSFLLLVYCRDRLFRSNYKLAHITFHNLKMYCDVVNCEMADFLLCFLLLLIIFSFMKSKFLKRIIRRKKIFGHLAESLSFSITRWQFKITKKAIKRRNTALT